MILTAEKKSKMVSAETIRRVTILLPAPLYLYLRKVADEQERDMSTLIRLILRQYQRERERVT